MSESGKVGRLIRLINLTERKYSTYSREKIMNILGISETTFYRYLEELREEAEVPIYYDQQTKGYKIREDYYLNPSNLKLSEALALILGGNILLNNNELPFYEEINMALAKLMAALPSNTKKLLGTVDNRIYFTLDMLVDYNEYKEVFNLVDKAANKARNVWIKYYSESRDDTTERVVSPYVLQFNNNGFLYLIGYCHWREAIRMFRLDKILEIELKDEKFEPPEDFSLDDYFGNAWGVERREEDMKIKLKFTGDTASWIQNRKYHSSQEIEELENGNVLMTFVTCSLNEVKSWVLKFGADVEVIAPEELREEVQKEVKQMWEKYL